MYVGNVKSCRCRDKKFVFANVADSVREKTYCKAPVTPNGVATAFVWRSKTMSARCGIAAKYA